MTQGIKWNRKYRDKSYNFANVNMSSSLTSIGNGAFYNCTKLVSVSMPSSLKSIGSRAFVNTAWRQHIIIENILTLLKNENCIDFMFCN